MTSQAPVSLIANCLISERMILQKWMFNYMLPVSIEKPYWKSLEFSDFSINQQRHGSFSGRSCTCSKVLLPMHTAAAHWMCIYLRLHLGLHLHRHIYVYLYLYVFIYLRELGTDLMAMFRRHTSLASFNLHWNHALTCLGNSYTALLNTCTYKKSYTLIFYLY